MIEPTGVRLCGQDHPSITHSGPLTFCRDFNQNACPRDPCTEGLHLCWKCRSSHHGASNCSLPPPPLCSLFNRPGGCVRSDWHCRNLHACSRCQEYGHSYVNCPLLLGPERGEKGLKKSEVKKDQQMTLDMLELHVDESDWEMEEGGWEDKITEPMSKDGLNVETNLSPCHSDMASNEKKDGDEGTENRDLSSWEGNRQTNVSTSPAPASGWEQQSRMDEKSIQAPPGFPLKLQGSPPAPCGWETNHPLRSPPTASGWEHVMDEKGVSPQEQAQSEESLSELSPSLVLMDSAAIDLETRPFSEWRSKPVLSSTSTENKDAETCKGNVTNEEELLKISGGERTTLEEGHPPLISTSPSTAPLTAIQTSSLASTCMQDLLQLMIPCSLQQADPSMSKELLDIMLEGQEHADGTFTSVQSHLFEEVEACIQGDPQVESLQDVNPMDGCPDAVEGNEKGSSVL